MHLSNFSNSWGGCLEGQVSRAASPAYQATTRWCGVSGAPTAGRWMLSRRPRLGTDVQAALWWGTPS